MSHMPAKKRSAQKTSRKPTVPRGVQPRTVAIKRTYQATTVGTDTGTFKAIGAYDFKLSYLPAYTDFTNLFDQYRIVKVKIEFIPNLTGNGAPGNPGLYSIFHMAVDHTDVGTPANTAEILQYDQHRTVQPFKPFSMTFKPAPSAQYFNTLTSSGYGPRAGAWIDGSSPAIAHYGLKYVWDCNSATATQMVPFVTVWAEFREAR